MLIYVLHICTSYINDADTVFALKKKLNYIYANGQLRGIFTILSAKVLIRDLQTRQKNDISGRTSRIRHSSRR